MDKKAAAAKKLKERTEKKTFRLPEGDTTFRVLPNAKGADKLEYIEYGMHSKVGANGAYLRCGKNSEGKGECWLCDELLPKLAESKQDAKRQAAEGMRRIEKFAVQVAYMDDGEWKGPKLWEMPSSIANSLLGMMSRRAELCDPKKGYNLMISRSGTSQKGTRYGDLDKEDEPSAVDKDLLARLKTFKEIVQQYSGDKQKEAFYGTKEQEPTVEEPEEPSSTADLDEDDDSTPRKTRSAVAEEPEEAEADELLFSEDEDEAATQSEDDIEDLTDEVVVEDEEEPARPARKPAAAVATKPAGKPVAGKKPVPVTAKSANGKPRRPVSDEGDE